MKTIYRVLIILFVAALLGGAIYAAVSAGGNGVQARERGEFDRERFEPREGGIRPEGEDGIWLPFGMVKSLIIIFLIGAPYYFLWNRKLQKVRAPKPRGV